MSAFKLSEGQFWLSAIVVMVCSIIWVHHDDDKYGECPEPTWEELYPYCEPSHEWFVMSIDMTLKCSRERFDIEPKPEDHLLPDCL